MPEYENKPLMQIAGNVGKDPTSGESSRGKWANFSLACNISYEDGPDSTRWYTVFAPKRQVDAVMRQIHKGSKVAAEGVSTMDTRDGQTRYTFNAFRLWLMEPLAMAQSTPREDEDL
jgi:single-stranded DNA-binding protein